MNINEFYKKKISSQEAKCIGYSFVPAPAGDNTPKQSLAQNLTRMCNAANGYINTMQGQADAKSTAAAAYNLNTDYSFDEDYSSLEPVLSPDADTDAYYGLDHSTDDQSGSSDDTPTSSRRNHNLNDDNRSNSKTQSPKKKSKKSFKPTTTPVKNDQTTGSRRSAGPSSAAAMPKKDRTKSPTTAQRLGQRLKSLNKDIYYDFDGTSGDNIRIFFCSDKLPGADIYKRAHALDKEELLEALREYFDIKFCLLQSKQIDKYYEQHRSREGAFFLHVLPRSRHSDLLRALDKMGLPSADAVHALKKTIKVPKPRKKTTGK